MPRYIDADALGIGYANPKVFNSEEYARGWNSAIEIINSAPTLSPDDVRGVVHCHDCRYAERRCPVGIKTEIFCKLFSAGMKAYDYCSYGARMKGAGDGTTDNS